MRNIIARHVLHLITSPPLLTLFAPSPPNAHDRMLTDRVESAFSGYMVKAENTSGLMEMGHTDAALDVLAQRGDWDRLWETAAKERVGKNVTMKYAARRVQQLVDDGGIKMDEAVETLLKHGAPSSPSYYDMYRDLTCGILGRDKNQESKTNQPAVVADLREVLYGVAIKLRGKSTDGKIDMEVSGSGD